MKWLSKEIVEFFRVKSNNYKDVWVYLYKNETKYLGKFKQSSKFFSTEKEAAIWADTQRIKNNLEPRNILKKK